MYPDNPLQDAILVHRVPSAAQLSKAQNAKIVLGTSGFLMESDSSLFYGSDQPFQPVLPCFHTAAHFLPMHRIGLALQAACANQIQPISM